MLTPSSKLVWQDHPLRELLRLAWPTVLSLLSVSTMTLVDTLFIGRLGAVELAAAGLGGVCVFAIISFGLALFGASKVQVALYHGAENRAQVNRALGAFLRLSLALGMASCAVGWGVALLMPFISADARTGILAAEYAAVRSFGFPFVMIASAIGQWLHAQGDSKSAMHAALAANAANLPLNYILIFVLDWGISGAAAATALSRVVEALWLVVKQRSPVAPTAPIAPGLHLQLATWSDSGRYFRLGLPTGLERVLDMVAFAAVPILLSRVGPLHVAAHQVVLQITLFSFLPLMALNESVSVLISQALGGTRGDLARSIARLGMTLCFVYGTLFALLCLSLRRPLFLLFTSDPQLIELGASTLLIGALVPFVNATYNCLKGILRGLSIFTFVAWVTVVCAWVITPPLTYVLGVHFGMGAPGAWLTLAIEVTIGAVILGIKTNSAFQQLNRHIVYGSQTAP